MKEYCVDLKIAKELKENGFPQCSEFKWHEDKNNNPKNWVSDKIEFFTCSAPLSDEILDEIPNEIYGYILEIIRYEDGTIEADYARSLWREEDVEYLIKSKELFYKLSNCLSKLWLYLKKEGHIK